jgi:hypothetical protein
LSAEHNSHYIRQRQERDIRRMSAVTRKGRSVTRNGGSIPDKGQVMTRYYGWYANRPHGVRKNWPAIL